MDSDVEVCSPRQESCGRTSAISDDTPETDATAQDNSWLTAGSNENLAHICYRFKINTLNISNPAQQQSDLRIVARHDIYMFDTTKQTSSVSKD